MFGVKEALKISKKLFRVMPRGEGTNAERRAHLLRGLRGAEEDRDEGQPNDAGGVHGEADGLGLVEGLRHASGFDGVDRAGDHEQHAVAQQADERQVGDVALEHPAGHHRVRGPLVLVVDDGLGGVHAEPDAHAEQLHRGQGERDGQLGGRGNQLGRAHGHGALLEDAVDAVGFGEQGGVTDAHAQTQEDPPHGADPHIGGGDHEEGGGVTEEDAGQQHVAQLSARRLHDGGVVVADERGHHEHGGHDAGDGDQHGEHGPRRAPLQLDDGDGDAAGAVDVGPQVEAAHLAGEGVRLVLVAVAAVAVPTARHALHDLLALARLTGQAADGGRDLTDAAGPLHRADLRKKARRRGDTDGR